MNRRPRRIHALILLTLLSFPSARAAVATPDIIVSHGLQVGAVWPWAGYGLPMEEHTLPQVLKDAGYSTHLSGKRHLGHCAPEYLPTRRGFDTQHVPVGVQRRLFPAPLHFVQSAAVNFQMR